jgi:hypothetical protein
LRDNRARDRHCAAAGAGLGCAPHDVAADLEDEIARYDTELEKLSRGLTDLTEPMLTRSAWENAHTAELQQLSNLDRDITLTRVLERPARRTLERGIDRGMELGL